MTLPTRRLGRSDLVVSAVGLGCLGMSAIYGPADPAESRATLDRALELGVTLLDTANLYGAGRNETLVGEAVKGRREQVVLATKVGLAHDSDGVLRINGRPDNVRACLEASLRRLGTDYVDLYYQHRVDPEVPIEETVGAMADLVSAGTVRFLGLSEASARSIERAVSVHPIAALQSEWSLFSREIEADVLATARRHGIGIVAFSPLGRGLLTGAFAAPSDFPPTDFRSSQPRFQGEAFAANRALADRFADLAAEKAVTPAQLALAWVLARGEDVVPIPGTKRRRSLEENVAATAVTLSEDELARLDRLAPPGAAVGLRYAGGRGLLPSATSYGDSPER